MAALAPFPVFPVYAVWGTVVAMASSDRRLGVLRRLDVRKELIAFGHLSRIRGCRGHGAGTPIGECGDLLGKGFLRMAFGRLELWGIRWSLDGKGITKGLKWQHR